MSTFQQLDAAVNLLDQLGDPGLGFVGIAGGLERAQELKIVYLLVQISNLLLVFQALLFTLGEPGGKPVRTFPRAEGDPILPVLRDLHFLTDKKTIYCANVAEDDLADPAANPHVAALKAYADAQGCEMVTVCAQMEADLAGLSDAEAKEFLSSYGLKESSLDRTIKLAYHTLGLASFLTAGPKEVRAWTFHRGWKAPQCAGVIHTDFEKGFIRAQVIAFDDYVKHNGEAGARAAGALRPEGKEYEMQDGDVVEFMFNK